jgi:alpha-galactosidase
MLITLNAWSGPTKTQALNNGLARTPPMGWNSWNKYVCHPSERIIMQMADALIGSGMRALGYEYVNIDDCWASGRDGDGNLVADPNKFPHGIKYLADYVHAKGLKLGIYTDAGSRTCAGRPGSLGYEQQDANTFASWDIDYLKVDWCSGTDLDPKTQYTKMRDALLATGRPIMFSICQSQGENFSWAWGPSTGHLWRTTPDIGDDWGSVLRNLHGNMQHPEAAGPGGWNDPDTLEVGNGKMTTNEYRVQFSMWAMMAAPLIASNDLTTMSEETRDILTNAEVIAVDQDPAGKQGVKVKDDSAGLQVWSKPLRGDGMRAVALLNVRDTAADITVEWRDLGLRPGSAAVRDLWAHADLGSVADRYTTRVPGRGVVMLKVIQSAVVPPTGSFDFAGSAFQDLWTRSDALVKQNAVDYSWIWGPAPFTQAVSEPYAQSPGKARSVQYFDKSRMEINQPDAPRGPWYVTNGRLTDELITGRMQTGDAEYEVREPAAIAVAGDPQNTFPLYQDLRAVYRRQRAADRANELIFRAQDGSLQIQPVPSADEDPSMLIVQRVGGLGIPKILWEFMNRPGRVLEKGQAVNANPLYDWRFVVGEPLTEAYWTVIKIDGRPKGVLVQAFERRVLTYTPTNPPPFQVEMGNIGRHYFEWRYGVRPQ